MKGIILFLFILIANHSILAQLKFTFNVKSEILLDDSEQIRTINEVLHVDFEQELVQITMDSIKTDWDIISRNYDDEIPWYDVQLTIRNEFGQERYYHFFDMNSDADLNILRYDEMNNSTWYCSGEFQYSNYISSNYTSQSKTLFYIIIETGYDYSDSINITDVLLKNEAFLVVYKNHDQQLYFANVWPNNKSQSFGRINYLGETSDARTKKRRIMYNWYYANTYNMNSGYCTITFSSRKKEDYSYFVEVEINPDDSDRLYYTGYSNNDIVKLLSE